MNESNRVKEPSTDTTHVHKPHTHLCSKIKQLATQGGAQYQTVGVSGTYDREYEL